MTIEFTPQYITLGHDRGFRDDKDLLLWLQTTVADLLRDYVLWDLFIRDADGNYYAAGAEIKIRSLDPGESKVIQTMDQKGLIPKGLGVARAQLLEELYETMKEVELLDQLDLDATDEAMEVPSLSARQRLAEIRSMLLEQDMAREKNQAEADSPPSQATMEQRAQMLDALTTDQTDLRLFDDATP